MYMGQFQNIDILAPVGKGAYGTVYKACLTNQRKSIVVAVKKMLIEDDFNKELTDKEVHFKNFSKSFIYFSSYNSY